MTATTVPVRHSYTSYDVANAPLPCPSSEKTTIHANVLCRSRDAEKLTQVQAVNHDASNAVHDLFASARWLTRNLPVTHCENCGGEGGFPEPHGEWGLCPCCEGTGEVISSGPDLISLNDLDAIDREKPAGAYDDN